MSCLLDCELASSLCHQTELGVVQNSEGVWIRAVCRQLAGDGSCAGYAARHLCPL